MLIEINLQKLERGLREGRVKVTRGGKTFWRKQRVGQKDGKNGDKIVEKMKMLPDNVESVKTFNQLGIEGGFHEDESFVVNFKDKFSAIYKVIDRWRIVGEVAAYQSSKIIGWDIVPETVDNNFGRGDGSCQMWITNGKEPYEYGDEVEVEDPNYVRIEEKHFNDLSKIFLFDLLCGNSDRRSPNVIVKDDRCYAIDNELWGKHRDVIDDMKALEDRCSGIKNRDSNLLNFLAVSFENDKEKFELFKRYVIENMNNITDEGNKIVEVFKQFGIKSGIDCMEDNLFVMKEYYRMGIK
jgi:hypothetical protein